ncbi:hypothetical protein, partial [Tritonibacter sp. SIMBA_163]|uniref:hypothetical protein n=1 Tax=Tritonibacter sp. SIMBA_163 TaxID=3080868 RepID=UPI003980EC68
VLAPWITTQREQLNLVYDVQEGDRGPVVPDLPARSCAECIQRLCQWLCRDVERIGRLGLRHANWRGRGTVGPGDGDRYAA